MKQIVDENVSGVTNPYQLVADMDRMDYSIMCLKCGVFSHKNDEDIPLGLCHAKGTMGYKLMNKKNA